MLSPVQQPYRQQIIHVRWSGEGLWIPLGDHDLHDLALENQTSHPAPGHIILYPGGISEARASLALEAQKPGADRLLGSQTEFLLAYGGVDFSSKVGQLAGNHFLTIIEGQEQLAALGKLVLWGGAQTILFEEAT